MAHPWLSVVMPTFNGERYLGLALESIRAQELLGVEVVAVDDGSTDGTLPLLRSYTARLPLRIVESQGGRSWVRATNQGLAVARGEYACFLHQDDLWLPGRLAHVHRSLGQHQGTVFLLHPAWFIDARGRRLGLWRPPLPAGRPDLPAALVVERLLVQNFIPIPSPVFLREAATRSGSLDSTLWFTADWDLWLRLAELGRTLYLSRALSAFRIHPLSQTSRGSVSPAEFRSQYEHVLDRYLEAWRGQLGAAADVEAAARLSVEVNSALATLAHRKAPDAARLLRAAIRLSPRAWHRYLTHSRLHERLGARLRGGLWRRLSP
jgi:glycosyltransferase involved in cell wall biosynthesis